MTGRGWKLFVSPNRHLTTDAIILLCVCVCVLVGCKLLFFHLSGAIFVVYPEDTNTQFSQCCFHINIIEIMDFIITELPAAPY